MKPQIICHIMSSVDGRLLTARWSQPFNDTPSSTLFQVYATIGRELGTSAWMFGKNTVREIFTEKFDNGTTPVKYDEPAVFFGERSSERIFIVFDPDSDIRFTSSVLRNDNILVVVGHNTTKEYLAHLREKRISYIIIGNATNLREGLDMIGSEFGISSISVQGGGVLNGELLTEGLIDELSLVIYPGIDGLSGVPSIFEYMGGKTKLPAYGQSMQLISASQREHDVMWLRYKFHSNHIVSPHQMP